MGYLIPKKSHACQRDRGSDFIILTIAQWTPARILLRLSTALRADQNYMTTRSAAKLIAASLSIIGFALGFVEQWYAPAPVPVPNSPEPSALIGWLGLALAALATFAYFLTDLVDNNNKRGKSE